MRLSRLLLGLLVFAPVHRLVRADDLNEVATSAVRRAQEKFPDEKLKDQDVAVTLIDLRDPAKPRTGSFRGGEPIYPASVVKLFYLAATHRWLEDGKLRDSEELRRTLRDMIVESSNDACGNIVDALSGVGNGAPLTDEEMKAWADKRQAVNRYCGPGQPQRVVIPSEARDLGVKRFSTSRSLVALLLGMTGFGWT